MTDRIHQPGDRVEWDNGKFVHRGTIERIGGGKSAGLAMVVEDGDPKSRPVSLNRLRISAIKLPAMIGGGDAA